MAETDVVTIEEDGLLPWATSSTQPILTAARPTVASAAPAIAQRGLTLVGFAAPAYARWEFHFVC